MSRPRSPVPYGDMRDVISPLRGKFNIPCQNLIFPIGGDRFGKWKATGSTSLPVISSISEMSSSEIADRMDGLRISEPPCGQNSGKFVARVMVVTVGAAGSRELGSKNQTRFPEFQAFAFGCRVLFRALTSETLSSSRDGSYRDYPQDNMRE